MRGGAFEVAGIVTGSGGICVGIRFFHVFVALLCLTWQRGGGWISAGGGWFMVHGVLWVYGVEAGDFILLFVLVWRWVLGRWLS